MHVPPFRQLWSSHGVLPSVKTMQHIPNATSVVEKTPSISIEPNKKQLGNTNKFRI